MKSRETKQKDLDALTASLQNSKSAMVVGFSKVTVTKDQEFRSSMREAGASYQVVKNTLARIAVKDTPFEDASEHFKGVTALAWTENDPVVLSKAISKFMKDNADFFTFKAGVIDGKVLDLQQLTTIANLPSKEELISKLLFVLQSSAQRLVTVLNAVPRDLAVVIKQIGESKPAEAVAAAPAAAEASAPVEEAAPAEAEVSAEAPDAEEAADVPAIEAAPVEESAEAVTETADEAPATQSEADAEEASAAPDDKSEESLEMTTEAQSPDDKSEEVLENAPGAEAEEKA